MENKNSAKYLIILIPSILLLYRSGAWGVLETSEARYAEIAREMYESGDLLHPTLLNIGHYHKPPLTYWITTLAYQIFGVNEFATRFFLLVAFVLQMVLIYKIAASLFKSNQIALWSAMLYASFPGTIASIRALTTDAFLNTFILIAIYSWILYRSNKNKVALIGFYIALALGFLTKGPVVFVIPLIFVWAFNKKNQGEFTSSNWKLHISGIMLLIVIDACWFLLLFRENKEFLNYFLIDHTVNRFATNQFSRSKPFWFYFAFVPLTCFPWFFFIIQSFVKSVKNGSFTGNLCVVVLWLVIPLIFFSMSSSKLLLYVLPVYPAIAIASAFFLDKADEKETKFWNYFFLGYSILIGQALTIIPFSKPHLSLLPEFFVFPFLILLCIAVIQNLKQVKIKNRLVFSAYTFTLVLTMYSTHFLSANKFLDNSTQPVTDFLEAMRLSDRDVIVFDERLPSIAFKLRKDIISVYASNRSLKRETQFERNGNWQKYLIDYNTPEGRAKLKEISRAESVMILKADEKFAAELFVFHQYQVMKKIHSWLIYY